VVVVVGTVVAVVGGICVVNDTDILVIICAVSPF